MGMMFYDYEFMSEYYQNVWRCIINNTFENMELYYRKQLSLNRLLSYFKKAFHIAPITVKNSIEAKNYKYKLLVIYLLTKYSKEDFTIIAKEFNTTIETINLIYTNHTYSIAYHDEIKIFFKEFEDAYLENRKSTLALEDILSSRYLNVKEDIIQ